MENFPIIDKMGGRVAVRDKLSRHLGIPLGKNIIHTWHERGFIPRDKIIALMDCAEKEGVSYQRCDFGPDAPPPKPRAKVREKEVA